LSSLLLLLLLLLLRNGMAAPRWLPVVVRCCLGVVMGGSSGRCSTSVYDSRHAARR